MSTANLHTSCNKRVAYAWAKFYEATRLRHTTDVETYRVINQTIDVLPEHIKSQYLEMMTELKKSWDCPICMEMIQPDNLDITNCGHFFCKPCLTSLVGRTGEECKCPVCRRKIVLNRGRVAPIGTPDG